MLPLYLLFHFVVHMCLSKPLNVGQRLLTGFGHLQTPDKNKGLF